MIRFNEVFAIFLSLPVHACSAWESIRGAARTLLQITPESDIHTGAIHIDEEESRTADPGYEAGSTSYVVIEQRLFIFGAKDVDEPHLGCRVDLGRSKRHAQSLPVAVRTVAQGDRCVHHS